MSKDDLKRLQDAMRAAAGKPDAATRDAHLRLAAKNFDTLQGMRPSARPMSERPAFAARWKRGVAKMFHGLTSRGALAATTSIAAVGIGVFVLWPQIQGGGRFLPVPGPGPLVATQAGQAGQAGAPADRSRDKPLSQTRAEPERDEATVESAPAPAVAAPAAPAAAPSPGLQLRKIAPAPLGSLVAGSTAGAASYDDATITGPVPNGESFANGAENPVRTTLDAPVSTFSIDVDTASYSIVRSSILGGRLPDPDSVRVEEMINYFPYEYPAPAADGAPFRPTLTVMQTPWNSGTELVHVAIQGRMPALAERPPLNLVFLVDTSGSMNSANKLPLLKQSFRLMLPQLRPEDRVAIVTYAGSAGEVLAPTPAGQRATILAALDRLDAGGATAGQAGLQQAYGVAETMAKEGDVTRVILATDGDFNVGVSDPEQLKTYIEKKRESGVYLSVLGFGRGNLDDATMQALAQNGNGTAAYIDTLSEAQKVLVDQLSGALFPIADDVKIQVEFNPAQIAEYRLIGYETRALRREDFNNDRVDAGEIGAGTSVTAIYEVTPVGSPAVLNSPLRYGDAAAPAADASSELGYLKLRYKRPGESASQLIRTPILAQMTTPDDDVRFSVAIAGFGQLLRGGSYLRDWGYGEAIALAEAARGKDPYGYRSEAVRLMRLARSLSRK